MLAPAAGGDPSLHLTGEQTWLTGGGTASIHTSCLVTLEDRNANVSHFHESLVPTCMSTKLARQLDNIKSSYSMLENGGK